MCTVVMSDTQITCVYHCYDAVKHHVIIVSCDTGVSFFLFYWFFFQVAMFCDGASGNLYIDDDRPNQIRHMDVK